jgi:hypothetical protein
MFNEDIPEIVRLEMLLQEARDENRVKPRTAKVDFDFDLDDAAKLLEEGYDIKYISKKTRIPESAIAKYEEEKREFHSTGELPSTNKVHTTFSGSSWTNYW